YYAMDRDKRWERVERAYDVLTLQGEHTAADPIAALQAAYARGESDEFVAPTAIDNTPRITSGDSVCYLNFRSDRARALSYVFALPGFHEFEPKVKVQLRHFMTMTVYDEKLTCPVFFPNYRLKNTLAEYLASHGRTQFRLAETEKYAHVTFFFNGGNETPVLHEARALIPSPKVATYDLKPEMSAFELCDTLVDAILSQQYHFILCNFANADMVGHTGNLDATERAIEAIDVCLGRIVKALEDTGSEALITADHGNAEFMFDPATGQAHTAHTCAPVPLVYIGRPAVLSKQGGTLADVAPTILALMDLTPPSEMTGHSLITFI
ncbi:MAG: 2,3-bisphosphoglycerate-independent phosphoglycerate mutase, partial [Pseudomonadota bacterium]